MWACERGVRGLGGCSVGGRLLDQLEEPEQSEETGRSCQAHYLVEVPHATRHQVWCSANTGGGEDKCAEYSADRHRIMTSRRPSLTYHLGGMPRTYGKKRNGINQEPPSKVPGSDSPSATQRGGGGAGGLQARWCTAHCRLVHKLKHFPTVALKLSRAAAGAVTCVTHLDMISCPLRPYTARLKFRICRQTSKQVNCAK